MNKREWKIVSVILVIAGLLHGMNMFGFPYYENDEGVYLSQAWSLITQGKLAPYTYWYDHAPAGWIFTALWLVLTRGVFTFGFSINSGRVLMLLIHLGSAALMLVISKRLTGKLTAGIIGVLLFSVSPLAIYFQRRLLLDNLMIFWVLAAYALLLSKRLTLIKVLISSLLLGWAVLTKENAIFFIPGFLITLIYKTPKPWRLMWTVLWGVVLSGMVGSYFYFAALKGELFPTGTLFGGNNPHVSLIETLKFQTGRQGGNSLQNNLALWMRYDPVIILTAIASTLILSIFTVWKKKWEYLGLVIMVLGFIWFLVRGGIVIEFYIVPVLALFALTAGIVGAKAPKQVISAIVIVYLMMYIGHRGLGLKDKPDAYYLFASQQTAGQKEAVNWIKENVSTNEFIAIDNYSYLEFHAGEKKYPLAHWYWKIDADSEIRDQLLKNDFKNISYVVKTPQMEGDMLMGVAPLVRQSIANSKIVTSFGDEGWQVEIWAPQIAEHVLRRTWETYKLAFITSEGRVIDPSSQITTSEGQAYALLRAAWMKDTETFERVWNWTKTNLQRPDGLFIWKWKDGAGEDQGAATDADTDMATALLLAGKKFEAIRVIRAIWDKEVRVIGGMPTVVAGDWAKSGEAVINPSYFAPYAYRMFAGIDPEHNWMSVVDSSYRWIEVCTNSQLGQDPPGVLPPNWCSLSEDGIASKSTKPGLDSTDFSYDAIRTIWRIALDADQYNEPRARELLFKWSQFLTEKWKSDGKLVVGYTRAGTAWEDYESAYAYAIYINALRPISFEVARDIYNQKVLGRLYENLDGKAFTYWEDPKNYYTQNWAWFGSALYLGNLPLAK